MLLEQTTNSTNKQKRFVRRAEATGRVKAIIDQYGGLGSDSEIVRQQLRQKCKEDFWFFQYHAVGNRDTLTDLHLDLCKKVQSRIEKGFTIWLLPRFHLKTSCITVGGILWRLINNPHLRHLVVNAKLETATDILAEIRNVVETNEVFRWLFPEYCVDLAPKSLRARCKWLTDRLDFPCSKYAGRREGNIRAMGVEASLVSQHYDELWFDDSVNDVNSATKQYRDKIFNWFRNALQLRHDLASPIRIIGTRWHFDDLYSRLLKKERARRKKLSSLGQKITPELWIYHRQIVEKVEAGGETIAGYDNVQPIWPERFTGEQINKLKEDVGSYVFSCQFMNNPLPDEEAIFKYSDINQIDEFLVPQNLVHFISADIAVEDTEDGDWWVITVAGFDSRGEMYVLEIIRDKLVTSTFLAHIAALTKKWNPIRVGIETVAFQNTLLKVYKEHTRKTGVNIPWMELKRTKKSKRARILALQPRVERGDFNVVEDIKNVDWLIEEMTTYPRSPHDDILDTLADLEAMYYAAPEDSKTVEQYDTFEAVYGDVTNIEDELHPSFSCSVINVA